MRAELMPVPNAALASVLAMIHGLCRQIGQRGLGQKIGQYPGNGHRGVLP
jgi:hypothetical protein